MNTCIVCGGAAGSGEHVFPASLGGRRVNKKIYCTIHDNGYSSLVSIIGGQLDVFNALLGVENDHTKKKKYFEAKDPQSGLTIRISEAGVSFLEPQILSREVESGREKFVISFDNERQVNEWISKQKSQGKKVEIGDRRKTTYYFDNAEVNRMFGGKHALGAVGYIAQTFLAQEFPELARSAEVKKFIIYTQAVSKSAEVEMKVSLDQPEIDVAADNLGKAIDLIGGVEPVQWEFDGITEDEGNTFDFGHRVIVGFDAKSGQIYGRIAFFSTIIFSVVFGYKKFESGVESRCVIVDIDPLASSPPNDIKKFESKDVKFAVKTDVNKKDLLFKSIKEGYQAKMLGKLLNKIETRSIKKISSEIYFDLNNVDWRIEFNQSEIVMNALNRASQNILNTVKFILDDFKDKMPIEVKPYLLAVKDILIKYDANSINGISQETAVILHIAKAAIAQEIILKIKSNKLSEKAIEELIGSGVGAHAIAKIIIPTITEPMLQASNK